MSAVMGSCRGAATTLGAYLERCGATWGDASDVHTVTTSEDGHRFSWRVDLAEETLQAVRRGEVFESPQFAISPGKAARFQLYPKGDDACVGEDTCSLWLITDGRDLGPLKLRVGSAAEKSAGASDFCSLTEALGGGNSLDVELRLEKSSTAQQAQVPCSSPIGVQQSLQLSGLERADWQVFDVRELVARGELHSSPPFRFHHVLLGDMYLELKPVNDLCAILFRCRVPTMKLQVEISVGDSFSKSFVALGRNSPSDDLKTENCLRVNLYAPGVLGPDGSLKVACRLEKVVSIPSTLRDMIPKLDERALWPKRL